jgi:hypothetical protein
VRRGGGNSCSCARRGSRTPEGPATPRPVLLTKLWFLRQSPAGSECVACAAPRLWFMRQSPAGSGRVAGVKPAPIVGDEHPQLAAGQPRDDLDMADTRRVRVEHDVRQRLRRSCPHRLDLLLASPSGCGEICQRSARARHRAVNRGIRLPQAPPRAVAWTAREVAATPARTEAHLPRPLPISANAKTGSLAGSRAGPSFRKVRACLGSRTSRSASIRP